LTLAFVERVIFPASSADYLNYIYRFKTGQLLTDKHLCSGWVRTTWKLGEERRDKTCRLWCGKLRCDSGANAGGLQRRAVHLSWRQMYWYSATLWRTVRLSRRQWWARMP